MDSEFMPLRFPERLTGPLAITHTTVIPMDEERVLPDHSLVLEDGLIRALGPSREIETDGMQVVDGSSMYLIPGLADMYTHYREPLDAPLYLACGITLTRVSGSPFHLAMGRVVESGAYPSPRMIVTSPSIDGLDAAGHTDMPGGVPATEPEQAAALVHQYAGRGFHQIKAFSRLAPENLRALGQAAAEANVRLVGNCPNAMSWEEAIAAGMSCFEQLHLIARDHMLPEYQGQDYWDRFDPAPGTHLDFDAIRRLARQLAAQQIWSVPTLVFHQRASQPVEVSLANPALAHVPESIVNDWETTIVRWGHRGRVSPERWRELARERVRAFQRVVAIMHEEGAPLLPGTDSLNPYNVQGDSLHQELENFVAAGMTPYQALRCATSESARFVGLTDMSGTIAVGKRADLALLRANPIDDISAVRQVEATWVNGYYLTRVDLDDLLLQRNRALSGPPPLPSSDLPSVEASGSGTLVDEGVWRERICDGEYGRIAYRHTRLSDSSWLIEERHSGATPRRHPERRTTRLTLTPDFRLRTGESRVESIAGEEISRINWSAGSGYTVRTTEVDGYTSEAVLATAAMAVPGGNLAASVLPLLLAAGSGWETDAALPTLSIDAGKCALSTMTISVGDGHNPAGESDDVGGRTWRVKVEWPSRSSEQTYRVARDGNLVGMSEMLPLLWPRELVPIPEPAVASASSPGPG
jgi:imidazolonepropionase-like amidohydrolase